MQRSTASFQKRRWLLVLLLPLSLFSAIAPAAAHTYPNYIFPPSVRTSHASSALALSGEKIAIISPPPRRAFGVVDGNLSFAVQMLRTCSSSSSSRSRSSSSSMYCTLYLDGSSARDFSLPCDEAVTVVLTAAAAGACPRFINTNSASLSFRFRRRCDDCCILLHGPSSRRPHHHVDSDNATAGLRLVAITHLSPLCPNPVSSAA
jgi:hypothetical protein